MLDLRWSLMPHVGIAQLIGGVDPNSRNRCRLPQRSWAAAGCGVRCAGGAQESCHHGMKSSTANTENTGTRPNVPVCYQKFGFGFGYYPFYVVFNAIRQCLGWLGVPGTSILGHTHFPACPGRSPGFQRSRLVRPDRSGEVLVLRALLTCSDVLG